MIVRPSTLIGTASLLCFHAFAPAAGAQAPWSQLAFLVGEWSGAGGGEPGQGVGSFTFAPDLEGRILVRKAHSEYPAAGNRPAVVHDDLLIVYSPDAPKAIYFDNEGHVIHYDVTVDTSKGVVTFLSVDPPPAPRFRLIYTRLPDDRLDVVFEIANDDQRADFRTYVRGVVSRTMTKGGRAGGRGPVE